MLSKMNKGNRYSSELLDWLCIPDKLYSINDIKEAIYIKCNNINRSSIVNLDNNGLILFQMFSNPVRIDKIINFISYSYLINNNKPPYEHFDYQQKPLDVSDLQLIVKN
jgi:hypothetical protein